MGNDEEAGKDLAPTRRALMTGLLAAGAAGPWLGTSEASSSTPDDRAGVSESTASPDAREVAGYAACFTKGLPHDSDGWVDPKAYERLLRALERGNANDFERVPLGGHRKLANPQAAFAYPLLDLEPSAFTMPPAPRFRSQEQASELIELAWQAVLRDVPFRQWSTHPQVAAACRDLEGRGLPATPSQLFRGVARGDLGGPVVSQFLVKEVPMRPMVMEQRIRPLKPGVDYGTRWRDWLALQNGAIQGPDAYDSKRRFLRNGRDLAEHAHRDLSYQAFFCAALMLLRWGTPVDGGNPYKHSRTQAGFATLGPAFLLNLLGTASDVCLAVCWRQKWRVHRRLRPEAYGGWVEAARKEQRAPRLPDGLLDSPVWALLIERNGSALLPQAYPEGSPMHPSYPAAHAVIAGACATVIKAFFDESWTIPQPKEPSSDGTDLKAWTGEALRVGSELDKLASNMAMGRNWAGIHWRSDASAGLILGEQVALAVLKHASQRQPEHSDGFSITGFDGERQRV